MNAIDQLGDGWDVADQASDHAATPGARIHVTIDHDLGVDASDLLPNVGELQVGTLVTFDLQQPVNGGVFEYALGVAQGA
jgi:hypothetical protein